MVGVKRRQPAQDLKNLLPSSPPKMTKRSLACSLFVEVCDESTSQRRSQAGGHLSPRDECLQSIAVSTPIATSGPRATSCASPVTPHVDPICIGFFAHKSPSPVRPLATPIFPKCLSISPVTTLSARPLATLRKEHAEQEMAESMQMLRDAQCDGSVVFLSCGSSG